MILGCLNFLWLVCYFCFVRSFYVFYLLSVCFFHGSLCLRLLFVPRLFYLHSQFHHFNCKFLKITMTYYIIHGKAEDIFYCLFAIYATSAPSASSVFYSLFAVYTLSALFVSFVFCGLSLLFLYYKSQPRVLTSSKEQIN